MSLLTTLFADIVQQYDIFFFCLDDIVSLRDNGEITAQRDGSNTICWIVNS